nr:hypothetical protein [Tanacetum cinerariifolium]
AATAGPPPLAYEPPRRRCPLAGPGPGGPAPPHRAVCRNARKREVGIFNGPQLLTTFRQGDFFGELALLDAEPRSATAVAQSAVRAFRLDQDDFYDVMEERGEVLRNILRVLCQRLRKQNEA